MATMFSEIVLTEKQLAAIGSVAVESANLEHLLDLILCRLFRLTSQEAMSVFDKAMLQRKIELVSDFGKRRLRSNKRRREFDQIMVDVNNLNGSRISLIHGIWHSGDPRGTGIVKAAQNIGKAFATGSHLKTPRAPIRAETARKIALQMSAATSKLFKFALPLWLSKKRRTPKVL